MHMTTQTVKPVLVQVINDATTGGAQVLLSQLGEQWRSGFSVHLVVLRGHESQSAAYASSFLSVTYLDVTRKPLAAAFRFRRIVRQVGARVVHSHLLQSDLLNLWLTPRGVVRVSTVHTTGLSKADPVASRLVAFLVAKFSHRFGVVVACDPDCLKFTERMGYSAPLTVIENGVAAAARISYDSGSKSFLSLARWHSSKGHAVLLAAFRQFVATHSGWSLVLAGNQMFSQSAPVSELIDQLDLHELVASNGIQFVGLLAEPSVRLGSAAALIISSTYGEASPMAGIEALSLGVPVIATRVGGSAKLSQSERFTAEPGSVDGLLAAMVAFAELGPAERIAASHWSYEQALAHYSLDRCAEAYGALFSAQLTR